VELGRFGRFAANLLVGQKDGSYFRIESDGSLSCMLPEEIDNSIDTSKVTATNQTLQDTNTSQRLTASDIEALKAQVDMGSLDAKSMVEKLVQSSETFEKKNEFSQIKYVQRKQKKFLRWFVIRLPSARTICHHFMRRDPRKIMYA
jgi:tRNA (adenine-N(1)-)-methyltransferase non-catalytic subunit